MWLCMLNTVTHLKTIQYTAGEKGFCCDISVETKAK